MQANRVYLETEITRLHLLMDRLSHGASRHSSGCHLGMDQRAMCAGCSGNSDCDQPGSSDCPGETGNWAGPGGTPALDTPHLEGLRYQAGTTPRAIQSMAEQRARNQ